ncbi:MAG: cytidine/deoxycytidylate deaminase family protein [Lentisphaeria bacterium]|jgi:dCMP deaminase|nr:cytidine/deoxycytidylate deaminase family protein [Lentisphaeria bacterium]
MLPYKIVKIDASNWKRPSWDEYFLKLAMLASERATCPRMHCGCVLVKDKYVLATGYNGSLPGTPHCYEDGCMVVNDHCVRTNHAEINAICQASQHGISLSGGTAYVTNMPCTNCAKALVAAGIKRVVVFSDYHDTLAELFFHDAGVILDRLPMPETKINYDLETFSSARRFGDDDDTNS